MDVIPAKTVNLLQSLAQKGFKIAFFSNMTLPQRKDFEKELREIPLFFGDFNNKPNPRWFFDFFKKNNLDANKVVMVGDRIGTDMFAAYLAGVKERILVDAYSERFNALKAPLVIRFMRRLEKRLFLRCKLF